MSIISLNTVKTYLGISGATYDTILQIQLDIAESELCAYLDKYLGTTTYTNEVLHYQFSRFDINTDTALNGRETYGDLFVKNYPMTSITNITCQGVVVDPTNYYYDLNAGVISTKTFLNDTYNGLTITYVAGYTENTLPAILKSVILEGVRYQFQEFSTATQGSGNNIASKKVGDFSVSYDNTANFDAMRSYLAQRKDVLQRYLRFNI